MNKNNLKEWVGRFKVWYLRATQYISIVNFIMIFYLYIIESPMGFEWYHWVVIIVAAISVILFFDIRIIFPMSQLYIYQKNPGFTRLEKKVDFLIEKAGYSPEEIGKID